MTWLRGVALKKARNMTEETPFSKDPLDTARQLIPQIQAAFAAAAAATDDLTERDVLASLSKCTEDAKTSDDPETLATLAAALGLTRRLDIAISLLEQVCKTDENQPLLCCLQNRLNLGHFYSQTNRPQEALATYEELIKVWDKRNSQNCVVDSSIYNTIIHMAHIGIFYTARNIGTKLHDEGREEDAIPYLAKALLNMKYLPPSQENAPTGEAYGSPTLH
jgi:tetratricopeptide (TPR) repeat protein